jgi:hypothetical protein
MSNNDGKRGPGPAPSGPERPMTPCDDTFRAYQEGHIPRR